MTSLSELLVYPKFTKEDKPTRDIRKAIGKQNMSFDKIIEAFEKDGYVECASGKNRGKFRNYIGKKYKKRYTEVLNETVVGYTGGSRTLNRWCPSRCPKEMGGKKPETEASIGMYARWIKNKRILEDDVCRNDQFYDEQYYSIIEAFDENKTTGEIAQIIYKAWDKYFDCPKYHVLNLAGLRNPIVRFTLKSQ
jgi:hypothetical protein